MMQKYLELVMGNVFVQMVLWGIVLDTILGCLRAARQHKFNSAFGIDGGIRKAAMVVSIAFLMLVDILVGFNVASWLPETLRETSGLAKIGIGEFFCLLFLLYECVSILKNLYLCGCPTPAWLRRWLEKFLNEMTGELEENLQR